MSKICLSVACGAVFAAVASAKPAGAQDETQKILQDIAKDIAKINAQKIDTQNSAAKNDKDAKNSKAKDKDSKNSGGAKDSSNTAESKNAKDSKQDTKQDLAQDSKQDSETSAKLDSAKDSKKDTKANAKDTKKSAKDSASKSTSKSDKKSAKKDSASASNTSTNSAGALGASNHLSKQAFFEAVEQNTINLVKNKAQFDSLIEAQKAMNSWDSPYTEIETGFAKNAIGRNELEVTALFMLKPKLPWVQTLLHQSLKLQTEQYQKSYELYKNLAFISAKRLYLTYELTKEKYNVAIARENNFLSQLQIAKAKLDAGSMSKKDYISFNNSYLDAKLLKMQTQTQLLDLQRMLHQILGFVDVHTQINQNDIDAEILSVAHDVKVDGMAFGYADVAPDFARESLESSPYISILDLQAKNYQTNAKLANRDRFDTLELGGGLVHAESSNGAQLRFSIPLPVTPKNTHLKRKWLALHSGTLREGEITKNNLLVSMDSYLDQLHSKKSFIELQQENIQNKKDLVEMGKIAYEAQKISLFEYLAYQNSYMDSLITLADAKLEYVGIQSLLEETLGSMIGDK
ncbi:MULTISPECIES: TolC family protein [unclassified Helicobacter]|uniref:TolC family protein n=1 Tax=unclassified Helicobacter TaxID=2593540 RepID=UPI001F1FC27C|nr:MULTISPECIES: TolC family protein [unclassified Helicobacter]